MTENAANTSRATPPSGGTGTALGFGARCMRFIRDRGGVAAVEFALVAPLLLTLYFVTMEVAQGIETNKKIGRVGSMVADLITQQQTMNPDELDAIMEIGSSILKPYNRSNPKVYITAIQVDDDEDNPTAKVVWSRKLVNDATSNYLAPGTTATIPTKLMTPGSFLIRVSSELDYSPVITWSAADTPAWGVAAIFDGIKMAEIYYLRPRMSNTIPCADCNS